MHPLTKKTIELLDERHPDLATHIKDLNQQLDRVARTSWRFAHWRHRNFSLDSYDKWREDTAKACKEAEHFLHGRLPKI